MNPKVDEYIARQKQWQEESTRLRMIALDCGLTEEVKWGKPCYTFDGGNIVIIQGFKEYCALLFFKGALLQDVGGLLVKTGKNTRAGRQARFASVEEINENLDSLAALIQEAVEVEKAGLSVDFEQDREIDYPEEFQQKLDENPALDEAFHALTPGRQRAYLLHFSDAKQSKTRASRVDRYTDQILAGKGMNDR